MAKKKTAKKASKTGTGRGREVTVAGIFSTAVETAKKYFFQSLALSIIPTLIYGIAYLMLYGNKNPDPETALSLTAIVITLISYFLFGLSTMILMKIYDSGWKKTPGYFAKVFQYSLSRFLNVLGVILIYIAAMIVLILPGILLAVIKQNILYIIYILSAIVGLIYLTLRYGQAWIISLLQPNIRNSFSESDRICRGNKAVIFLACLSFMLLIFAVELILGMSAAILMPHVPLAILLIIGIPLAIAAVLIFIPLSTAFPYAVYRKLREAASKKGK